MRRVKDAQEIERLREAGRIGALGFKEAIRSARPGIYEYQIAAMAEFVFLCNGAIRKCLFPDSRIRSQLLRSCTTVRTEPQNGSGRHRRNRFRSRLPVLQSDITRTFPIRAKFSAEQAKVYQIVLEAQKAALAKMSPGATFSDLNATVKEVLGPL